MISSILEGCGLSFLSYCLYIELNPKIGNIFYRINNKAEKQFNIFGIIPLLKAPFVNPVFWWPENWDINFITFTGIGTLNYVIITQLDTIRAALGLL